MSAQHQDRRRPKGGWDFVDERAATARGDDDEALRRFTDVVIEASLLNGAGPSLGDRLFRAERQFRLGLAPAISERDMASAADEVLDRLDGPESMRISKAQLHEARRILLQLYPNVVRQDPDRADGVPPDMSPAEAMFVAQFLLYQRVSLAAAPVNRQTTGEGRRPRLESSIMPPAVAAIMRGIKAGVSDDSGPVMDGIHRFLDRAGFIR